MAYDLLQSPKLGRERTRNRLRFLPETSALEDRCLLSVADLTTTAQVTTITNGVSALQPKQSVYATSADLVSIQFATTDPDDMGSTPITHFNIIDARTNTALV